MRKALHLMGLLTDTDIEWLATNGYRQLCLRSMVLIREGHPIDSLFILLDGQLSVRIEAGVDKRIALLRSGDIVGEISFVDSRPPTASVLADQDSHVLVIPKEMLLEKLASDQGFASRFYRAIAAFLADRLRNSVRWLGYGIEDGAVGNLATDELDDVLMEDVSQAAQRFDRLLKAVQPHMGAAATGAS